MNYSLCSCLLFDILLREKSTDMKKGGNNTMKDYIPLKMKMGYGVGTIGKSLSYGLANGYLMLYFVNVLGLNTSFLAVMFFVARVWDGINDLLMGTVIDNTKTRFGKFRPWIMLGSVLNALTVIALFWAPGMNGAGLYIYVVIMFLLWDASYTMVDVGYWSMIPAFTRDSSQRDQISMIPRIFSGIAGIVTAFTLNVIDGLGGQVRNGGFLNYAILSSVVYVLTTMYCVKNTRERVLAPPVSNEKFSIVRAAKILISNDQALVIVVIMILFNLAINLTNSVAVFYFQFVLNQKSMFGFFNILMGASQAVALLGFPVFSRLIGRNRLYIVSMLLPCLGYAAMAAVNSASGGLLPFLIAAFVMSMGFGSMSVMQNVMLADAVDYGEWKSGERNEGIIFSMLTFLSKIASALSSSITLITFSIVAFGGQNATTATPQAVHGIELLMYGLPPIILVATLIVYLRKFKLKPEFTAKISNELEQRRFKAAEPS